MSTEIITTNPNQVLSKADNKSISARDQAFANHGLTDDYVAWVLKHIMENAVTANPKTGELIEDFGVKLQAAKAYLKETSDKPDFQIQIANVFPTWNNLI